MCNVHWKWKWKWRETRYCESKHKESIAARKFQFSMLCKIEIATPIFHFSTRFMIAFGNRTNAVELKCFQNHKCTQKSLLLQLSECNFGWWIHYSPMDDRRVGRANIVIIEWELIGTWGKCTRLHTIFDAFMTNFKSKLLLMIFSVLEPFRNGRSTKWLKLKVFNAGFFGKNVQSVMELTSVPHSKKRNPRKKFKKTILYASSNIR